MRDETGRPRGKDGYGGSRNVNGYGDYDENRSSRGYGGSRNVNGYGDYDDGRSRNVNGGDYDDSRRNPDYRNSRP